MSKFVYGVDIGGTTVKIGAFTVEGTLIEKWEIPTRKENNGSLIISDIAASIRANMQEKGYADADIVGVGVGAPGAVDDDGIIYQAINLGWGKFNLKKELEDALKLPAKPANDANVAALGEMWKGGGQGFKDMVMVTLGTGVGAGVIVSGKLVAGALGGGGEIGHMNMEENETVPCNCGCFGCLEQYASATGVVTLAKRRLAADDQASVLREGELSAKSIWDAVKAGDAVAMEIADKFGYYLGKGLAATATVTNPEVFVVGGGVSKAGEILFEYIRPYYKKFIFKGCKEVKFVLAQLGNDAGIYGAAKLMISDK